MRFFVALFAAVALLHAMSAESIAQQPQGGYGPKYPAGGYGAHGGYHGRGGCANCGHGYGYGVGHGYGYGYGHGHGGHHLAHHYNFNNVPMMQPLAYLAGPTSPTVTYPYYTTRGPRDFLQDACGPNPILPYRRPKICLPSIGP